MHQISILRSANSNNTSENQLQPAAVHNFQESALFDQTLDTTAGQMFSAQDVFLKSWKMKSLLKGPKIVGLRFKFVSARCMSHLLTSWPKELELIAVN